MYHFFVYIHEKRNEDKSRLAAVTCVSTPGQQDEGGQWRRPSHGSPTAVPLSQYLPLSPPSASGTNREGGGGGGVGWGVSKRAEEWVSVWINE